MNPLANKYRNKKVELDGILFDSKKEADVYQDLKDQKTKGYISDFQRQVRYELVPAAYEEKEVRDKKDRLVRKKVCVEKAVDYVADFVVTFPDGEVSVIDPKGKKTKDYIIKRKLMRHVHGIAIKEI
jgi:hypothetical protein